MSTVGWYNLVWAVGVLIWNRINPRYFVNYESEWMSNYWNLISGTLKSGGIRRKIWLKGETKGKIIKLFHQPHVSFSSSDAPFWMWHPGHVLRDHWMYTQMFAWSLLRKESFACCGDVAVLDWKVLRNMNFIHVLEGFIGTASSS